jgi:hypothetical protein
MEPVDPDGGSDSSANVSEADGRTPAGGGRKREDDMGIDRVGSGKIVSIEVLRRLAAGASGSSRASGEKPAVPPLLDESQQENLLRRLDEGLRDASRLGSQERERLLARLRADLEELPDVREDKVIEAKLRISSGYYNSDTVRREILRSVLESILPSRKEDPPAGATGDPRTGPAPESNA